MSEQEEKTLCGDHEGTSPGVTLSDNLILTRSRSTELLPPSTIRLDRENISSIGKLKDQGGIHSLYLQQNKIERIENLGCFPNLRFLCLAGNRIQRVENLQPLPHLCALDLSHNLIQVLDTGSWCWERCPTSCSWMPSPSVARKRREEALPAARMRMMSCSLSPAALSPWTEVPRGLKGTRGTPGDRGGSATSPLILLPPRIPGRFLRGSAPGAGRALPAEEEGDAGGAPGAAGGAAGTPGSAAEPGSGWSSRLRSPAAPAGPFSASGTARDTPPGIPRVPASSWWRPVPEKNSGEGDWCQRNRE
ncbi:leucine-rich repeat-containing protein 46 isoform X3 [Corapipo altera]|uniref:leucine-rich repeat-containing protein 46 isoform X3 n=1 Tax=Corapipo altera TaxID=415028 RepID=UPI000FD64698|nr:leucine-rich repeat-containing protein 46 isoform X3 [Corapipo altera]